MQMTPQLHRRQRLQDSLLQPKGMVARSQKQGAATITASGRRTIGICMAMQRTGLRGTGTQIGTETAAAGERVTGVAPVQCVSRICLARCGILLLCTWRIYCAAGQLHYQTTVSLGADRDREKDHDDRGRGRDGDREKDKERKERKSHKAHRDHDDREHKHKRHKH